MVKYYVKVWNILSANLENSAVVTGLEKDSFHSDPKKKAMSKECSVCCKTVLTSHATKAMLKSLQVRLQKYVNQGFPDVQVRLRKGRGIRD